MKTHHRDSYISITQVAMLLHCTYQQARNRILQGAFGPPQVASPPRTAHPLRSQRLFVSRRAVLHWQRHQQEHAK